MASVTLLYRVTDRSLVSLSICGLTASEASLAPLKGPQSEVITHVEVQYFLNLFTPSTI